MQLVLILVTVFLMAPAAMAQTSAQEPAAAAGGATATPITPEASGAHAAPGAPAEPSPAAAPASAAGRPVDVAKAVDCATLSQQFGDTLTALTGPTAKTPLDEAVKTTSSEQAGAGRKACMAHDYDAGMDQLRQAIGTLGKKPIV
jgi:hypothetical protein